MNFTKIAIPIFSTLALITQSLAIFYTKPGNQQQGQQLAQPFKCAARILNANKDLCNSGTLIDPRWVVTSARAKDPSHVIINGKVYQVVDQVVGNQTYPGKVIHPAFDTGAAEYDIQLLYLNKPVTHVFSAQRNYQNDEIGKTAWLTGFGKTNNSDQEGILRVGTNKLELTSNWDKAIPGLFTTYNFPKWRKDEQGKVHDASFMDRTYPLFVMPFSNLSDPNDTFLQATAQYGDGGGGVFINKENPNSQDLPKSDAQFDDAMRLIGVSYFDFQYKDRRQDQNWTALARLSCAKINDWINKVILEYALRERAVQGDEAVDALAVLPHMTLNLPQALAQEYEVLSVQNQPTKGGILIDPNWILCPALTDAETPDAYTINGKNYPVNKTKIYRRDGIQLNYLTEAVTTQPYIRRARFDEAKFFETYFTQTGFQGLAFNSAKYAFLPSENNTFELVGAPIPAQPGKTNIIKSDTNAWIDWVILRMGTGEGKIQLPTTTLVAPIQPPIIQAPTSSAFSTQTTVTTLPPIPVKPKDKTWNMIIYFHDNADGNTLYQIMGELTKRLTNPNVKILVHYKKDQTNANIGAGTNIPANIQTTVQDFQGDKEWIIENKDGSTSIKEIANAATSNLNQSFSQFINSVHQKYPADENFLMVGSWNSIAGNGTNGGWRKIADEFGFTKGVDTNGLPTLKLADQPKDTLTNDELQQAIGNQRYRVFFTNTPYWQCIENAYQFQNNFEYIVAPQGSTSIEIPHKYFLQEFLTSINTDTNTEPNVLIERVINSQEFRNSIANELSRSLSQQEKQQLTNWQQILENKAGFYVSLVKTAGIDGLCTKFALIAQLLQNINTDGTELVNLVGSAAPRTEGQTFDVYSLISKIHGVATNNPAIRQQYATAIASIFGNLKEDLEKAVRGVSGKPTLAENKLNGLSIFIPLYSLRERLTDRNNQEVAPRDSDRGVDNYTLDYIKKSFAEDYNWGQLIQNHKLVVKPVIKYKQSD
jgi:hypothetical protein